MPLVDDVFDWLPLPMQKRLFALVRPGTRSALERRRQLPRGVTNSLAAFDHHRCLFIHVPKTAGYSIGQALFGGVTGHDPLRRLWLLYASAEFDQYFKFAFVRNPWERLVSAHEYFLQDRQPPGTQNWVRQQFGHFRDFDEFVKHWVPRRAMRSEQPHFHTQSSFVTLGGHVAVDFLGRMENLEEDFATIARRLGQEVSLPRMNATPRDRPYRDYYTAASRQIVAEVYAEDIQRFGYQF
ncbi:MAG TPA: chondroitin 4-O-sulfotransferase [Planctomycetaceae bacterium]|nr:chondroitin 4-O-sulfotransferase [Planctomycetaceae bacterium]